MFKKIILPLSFFCTFNYSALSIAAIDTSPSIPSSPSNTEKSTGKSDAAKPIDKIEILSAWARASLSPNNNSAAYLTIKNSSDNQYILTSAGAMKVANNVELHQSYVDEKGISKMTAIDKIVIPANSEVVLKPAGMHIMLLDLKRTLRAGDKFKLDLKFQGVGTKTVDVEVKASN